MKRDVARDLKMVASRQAYAHRSIMIAPLFGLVFLLSGLGVNGQSTIFSESMGTVGGTTTIAAHETANGFDNDSYTMTQGGATNPGDVRVTSVSSGYVGASGAGNVYFTSTNAQYGFAIEGIDASSYTSLTVQFGYRKESAASLPTFALDYWDGSAYINIPFTFNEASNAAAGWYLSPVISLPVAAQINGLRLRWAKTGSVAVRIDDIVLKGTLSCSPPADPAGTITPGANPACGSTTLTYSGAAATIYWQTSATGTSTANPTTTPLTVTTSGTYYVRTYNGSCWSTNSLASAAITINAAQSITTQPTNQTINEPATATFSVVASNATGYQWQISTDGGSSWSDISGATASSYTTGATTTAMNGYQYHCIVSGTAPCTALTSNAGILTVNAPSAFCIDEGFNAGTTAPAGWSFTSIGGTYTSIGNYGASSPSLQMDATGDRVVTATVSSASELSFWIKGQGTNAASALLVEGYNGAWVTIDNITSSIPTTGTTYTYNATSTPALAAGFTQFRFTYSKSAGNLSFDDVKVQCVAVSNTITTGTVSAPPFTVTCAAGAAGTVTFTSTDVFNLGNTYTAQLSDAAGSFASPVNIGSLSSTGNSGTINISIPAATQTGAGYRIRVVSSDPAVTGTSSAAFTITLSGGPCSCFEIESILVDACDAGNEGRNEMFRFSVGATPINTGNITVTWPNPANSWQGICQNASTATTVSAINATITGGGSLLEPPGGIIPAGAEVMFFTNTNFNYTMFDFSTLNYTLYAIFQCPDNLPGHFVNYTTPGPVLRTLTMNVSSCGSDAVTYDASLLYNGDGARVDFDVPGNPTYSTSGSCTTVPIFPVPVELTGFTATCGDKETKLSWVTLSETNNNFFTIESSNDENADFVPVAVIPGAGNSNTVIEYTFGDLNSKKYYRLKQTDFDGHYTYSGIIASDCGVEVPMIYPSLVSCGETVHFSGEIGTIQVFDSFGRMVSPLRTEQGLVFSSPGIYMVAIHQEHWFRIIVQ